MDTMGIILWSVSLLQRIFIVLVPAMGIYGVCRILGSRDVESTLCAPFFGMFRMSAKVGALVWFIALVLLGVVFEDFYQWYHLGENPLIPFP